MSRGPEGTASGPARELGGGGGVRIGPTLSRRRRPRSLGILLATTVLVAASACSSGSGGGGGGGGGGDSSAQAVYAKFAAMSGSARQDALVKEAKKEGQVVLYTTNSDTVQKIAPLFEKKYGITVKGASQNTEDVRQKIEQENQAHKVGADVVETLALDLTLYSDQGILTPYKNSAVTSQLDAEATKYPDFVISSYYPYMVAWNTKSVKPGDVPNSWQDLADPKWKGKIAMVSEDGDWYATLYYYLKSKGMSDDQFEKTMRGIAKNAQVASGHGSTTNLLASGDFSVDLQVFQFDLIAAQKSGSPVAAKPYLKPIIENPIGAGLSKTAPHPAAALLWMDFYLTEGAKVFVDQVSRQTTNKTVMAGASSSFILPKSDTTAVPLEKLTPKEDTAWQTAYSNLTRGNDQILP